MKQIFTNFSNKLGGVSSLLSGTYKALALATLLVLPSVATATLTTDTEGRYVISTSDDLVELAELTYDLTNYWSYYNQSYILANDIDMDGVTFNTPICGYSTSYSFEGTFDGNGHVIKNLTMESSETVDGYFAFFGSVSIATIKDLGLVDVNISSTYAGVAALAGCAYGATITNCYVEGGTVTYNGSSTSQTGYVGGLICRLYLANVTADSYARLTNCYNSATVLATGSGANIYVGGLIGEACCGSYSDVKLTGCYNTGDVTINRTTGVDSKLCMAGGLVGKSDCSFINTFSFPLENCYNTGNVANNKGYVAGLIGQCSANYGTYTLKNCYNTGSVTDSFSSNAGLASGLLGKCANVTMENCYNTGDITTNCYYSGGLVFAPNKSNTVTMTNCYNTGAMGSTTISDAYIAAAKTLGYFGGLMGVNYYGDNLDLTNINIENCYYVSELGSLYGTEKTAAEFASGEVAYALEAVQDGDTLVWGQAIGTDLSPILSSTITDKVLQITVNDADDVTLGYGYTNYGGTFTDSIEVGGYIYSSFTLDDVAVTEETIFEADATVMVAGEAVAIVYTISYNNCEDVDTSNLPTSYTIEDEIELSSLTRPYYIFNGWTLSDGTQITTIAKGTTGDLELYASWSDDYDYEFEYGTYTITYVNYDNSQLPELTDYEYYYFSDYIYDVELPEVSGYERTGYESFLGWSLTEGGDIVTSFSTALAADVTVYGVWQLTTYTITYSNCNGVDTSELPSSYTIESETITLPSLTCDGYTFLGWTLSDGTQITTIAKGTTGDLELIATWSENSNDDGSDDSGNDDDAITYIYACKKISAIYTITGAKVSELQRGVNLVKYSDGTVQKVLVK